ncbi:type VI secretion system Vgr family protein [Sorangium sp. So ce1128]
MFFLFSTLMDDLITLSSSAFPAASRVVGFRGVEAISRLYEIEIFVTVPSEDGDFDLADTVGAKAQLVLDRQDDLPPFLLAGVLGRVDLLHEFDGRALVRGLLVPRLWELRLSRHSRIFTGKSVPEVIEEILTDNGFTEQDYEMRLGAYEPEEHICQYRESDLDFISRWMEREGIRYWFEHTEQGEKLILDDSAWYPDEAVGVPVRYYPQLGHDRSAGASFRSFSAQHNSLPASIKLRDHDYARPNLDVSGSAPVWQYGPGEVNLYGERFFSPDAGKRLAKLRAEELLARQVIYQAAGTRLHLRAGTAFQLEEHPRAPLNARYLVIEARHFGNQAGDMSSFRELLGLEHDDVYFVELRAIPAKTQFRPECRTGWPRIYGFENGVIDGPATTDYAQIDGQGRYNVKFLFDESSLKDGAASTWVRMMQPHGGSVEGFHFPLRKGTEVLLSFLGGDPDRPVITGVVPNAHTPSPVSSGNHTKNVIQTGGRNRLELDDLDGQQRITMSTPHTNSYIRMGSPNKGHTMIVHTDGPTKLDAGGNLDIEAGYQSGGGHKQEKVKGPVIEIYENTKNETVTLDVTETYNQRQHTEVATGQDLLVKAGGQKIGVNGGMGVNVDGGVTIKVGSGHALSGAEGADYKIDVVGGKYVMHTDQEMQIKSKAAALIESEDATMDIRSKGAMTLHAVGPLTTQGQTETTRILGVSFKDVNGDKTEFTHGHALTVKLATERNFTMSAVANFALSGTFDLKIGVFVNVNASATFTFATGVKAEFNSTIDLRTTPMKIQNATAGFVFNSTGCFVINTMEMAFLGVSFMSRAAIQLIN